MFAGATGVFGFAVTAQRGWWQEGRGNLSLHTLFCSAGAETALAPDVDLYGQEESAVDTSVESELSNQVSIPVQVPDSMLALRGFAYQMTLTLVT